MGGNRGAVRVWLAAGLLLIGLGAAAGLIAWRGLRETSWGTVDPGGAVNALAALAATIAGTAITWRQGARALSTSDTDIDRQAQDLAHAVLSAETRQRKQLLGGQDRAIDVAFTLQPAPAHHAEGAAAAGTLKKVVDYFRDLRPQRLVITGQPGAGKTVLAIELILGLLTDPDRTVQDPVPVRVPAAGWDPQVPVPEWLTRYLEQTFQMREDAARALVQAHRVLPVIDGLDEMDNTDTPGYNSRAGRALRALNDHQHGQIKARLVLTCRTGHYNALAQGRRPPAAPATDAPQGRVWTHDAARVDLAPLGPDQVWTFIQSVVGDHEYQRWRPVLEALTSSPGHVLAGALDTPWRLTLATTVYQQVDPLTGDYLRAPADLAAMTSPQAIADHLLSLFIPARIAAAQGRRRQPAPEKVHSYLAILAGYLTANETRSAFAGRTLSSTDLILHELWPLVGQRPRVFGQMLAMVVGTVLTSLMFIQMPGSLLGRSGGAAGVLFFNVSLLIPLWWDIWPRPVRFDLSFHRTSAGWAKLGVGFAIGLGFGLLFGLASGFWFGVMLGGTFGLASGLAIGLGSGLSSGLALGLGSKFDENADPRQAIRNDLAGWLAVGGISGLTAALAIGAWFEVWFGVTCGLAVWFWFGPGGTLALRYLGFLLSIRGSLPWRLGGFLHWSYQTGLLRVSGIAYQFRHRELQHYLADHPTP